MEKFGRVCKEYIIKEIAERFKDYPHFFVTTFSQIGVGDMEKLRKFFKDGSARYIVVKNSLLKQAMETSKKDKDLIAEFSTLISGSCGILFSRMDPVKTVRALVQFAKEHESLKIRGGFINGENVSSDSINLLANLPSKDVLLAITVASIKAPISGFVHLMDNLLRNLVGVLDAIEKKKGETEQA